MLDAGTGQSSLGWITQLETSHWTAITKDEPRADTLKAVYADKIREQDRIIIGDWRDSELCKDEVYDTVLADYLLGAIERFAPHFQDQLFERLRPHVGKRLYFIGIEPILEPAPTIGGQIIQEIHRLRDLCATMSYEHPYREYPLQWVLRNLPRAGFQIEGFQTFPKLFGLRYFHDMLDGCVQALPKFRDAELAASVAKAIARYRKEALSTSYLHFGVQISKDYVVVAKPV